MGTKELFEALREINNFVYVAKKANISFNVESVIGVIASRWSVDLQDLENLYYGFVSPFDIIDKYNNRNK